MRDIHQVLYRKERELERLRVEVEVLKTVIPLLDDDAEYTVPGPKASTTVIPFERTPRGLAQRLPSALRD